MAEIIGKAEEPFCIGDVVWLKGIDLKMVVSFSDGNSMVKTVECMWVDTSNILQIHNFRVELLTRKVPNLPERVGFIPPSHPITPVHPINQERRQGHASLKSVRDSKTGHVSFVEVPPESVNQPVITPKSK